MEYYTAREAMTRLGISASTFHRLVSEGKIARLTPPGSRRSLFRKEDVENLAEMLEHEQQAEFRMSMLKAYEQVLKAYEQAELAYSRTTGITRYLFLTVESLSDQDRQAAIMQLIERTKHTSQILEELQAEISKLVSQLQGK